MIPRHPSPASRPKQPPLPGGFTLLEMLTAMAISMILAGALLVICSHVMDIWRKGQNRLRANFDMRIALDILATDLESAVLKSEDYELLHSVPMNNVGTGGKQALRASWLMFFSAPFYKSSGNPGDITAISYRLAYQDSLQAGGPNPIFAIYRSVKDPRTTFDSVLGKPNIRTGFWDGQATNTLADFLVPNVVDFSITFWFNDSAGNLHSIDPLLSEIRMGKTLQVTPAPATLGAESRLVQADISMTVLTREGALLLQKTDLNMADLVRKHAYTYVRRVSFASR
jgi:prepilin-type N-terminal cleavage/methylation domain-containing protein